MNYFRKNHFLDIHFKPLGHRVVPMEYLKRIKKPDHHTWETWYTLVNENYLVRQKAELQTLQNEKQQKKDEEEMLDAITGSLFSDKSFEFNLNTNTNGVFQPGLSALSEVKLEDGSVASAPGDIHDKVVNELDTVKKTLEISETVKTSICEIVDLYLDPDVVFAMRKLKEIGKAMKGTPHPNVFANEVAHLNALKREEMQDATPQSQQEHSFSSVTVKKELFEEQSPKPKSMFPSSRKTSFEQFADLIKSGKRKVSASPARGGPLTSPKAAKKSAPVNLKSLTDTKMDIIASGVDVLKKKKTAKVANAIWQEVENSGRCVKEPPDTAFYPLMSALFPQYEKLQEKARGAQLKADLLDFIGSNVEYSRVSFQLFCHFLISQLI